MRLTPYFRVLRARRLASALTFVVLGLLCVSPAGAISTAGSGATFVDYAQCSNGGPPVVTSVCSGGWINGILNAGSSHYAEDQASPQRLELQVPSGSPTTGRTITIEYMTRKGAAAVHSYDYLTTWNLTQSAADRCQGLVASDCVAPVAVASCANQPSGSSPSTLTIPLDPSPVYPVGAGIDPATSAHQTQGVMTMYGGCLDAISVPVHSGVPAAVSTDDTAAVVITYHVNGTGGTTTADQKVQLLFGGHLATGAGLPNGWGAGLGASSASGGPYHIKLNALDGSSVGNRDNQIQAAAVLVPDLHIVKSADAPSVSAGNTIGFTVTVTNQQNGSNTTGTAENATLSDPLPAGGGVSWSISPTYTGPGSCSVAGSPQTLTCAFGKMDPGASNSVHLLSQTDRSSCGTYDATAAAHATNFQVVTANASTEVTCPSAVELTSFRANRRGSTVTVAWRTASEGGVAGFRVWASSVRLGTYTRVTRTLVPAAGRRAAYSVLDRIAPGRPRFYELESVRLDGSSSFTPPVRAGARS
jgi:uncharacterized repeat protein (TIGR01451 family)